jgi:NAD(P)-dependent dehydrogenase (short-subunit alcohol dehydrogenase family)
MFLKNRIALVTGGTRGIGRAIAEALLDAGATLAICGRDQGGVDRAVMEMTERSKRKVVGQAADVSRSEEVSRLFEFVDREAGGLDILVNNAGVGVFKPTSELTIEDWRTTIETNLSGVFYCCREALPRFKSVGAVTL